MKNKAKFISALSFALLLVVACGPYSYRPPSDKEQAMFDNYQSILKEISRIGIIPDSIESLQEEENKKILEKYLPGYRKWLTKDSILAKKLQYASSFNMISGSPFPSFHYEVLFIDGTNVVRDFHEPQALLSGPDVVVNGLTTEEIGIRTGKALRDSQISFLRKLKHL